jgi:hypothetical protein
MNIVRFNCNMENHRESEVGVPNESKYWGTRRKKVRKQKGEKGAC